MLGKGASLRAAGTLGIASLIALSVVAAARMPNRRWHGHRDGPIPITTIPFTEAMHLRPGHFLWRGASAGRPIGIMIDLGRQMAYVYQSGALIGISTISSGRRGYDTPTGSFPILQKAVWHRSTLYSGAPMPYMQRLTWGGVALHAGGVPGYRQSHGCIHLPWTFARALYAVTSLGAVVEVRHSLAARPFAIPAPVVMAAASVPPALAAPIGALVPTTAQAAALITVAEL